jgi:hypothetical protein
VYASAGILIFGHDAILLETRQLILERAGFQVWTATEAPRAVQILVTKRIDLFILCQSLSPKECGPILKTAHALRPEMENLVLGGELIGASAQERDTFLTTFLGPESLITFIQNKIGTKTVRSAIQ